MRILVIRMCLVLSISIFLFNCSKKPLPRAGISCIDPPVSIIQVGDTLFFLNHSTGATHYLWDFGDGNTSTSSNYSIPHAFLTSGIFNSSLTAYDQDGNSDATKVGTVVAPASGAASFWFATSVSYGRTVVTIGVITDTVKIDTGLPTNCGQSGCANFQLSPGNYNYSAAEIAPGTHTWNGSINIAKHGCLKQQLL